MTNTIAFKKLRSSHDDKTSKLIHDKNRNTENFPVGSVLIRPELRPHIHAFYNFARAADDISDHPLLEAREKITRLDRFAHVLTGDIPDVIPSVVAMRESLQATGLSPNHCLDLLIAFKRDAVQLRYKDWDDLLDYCRYSASPVGRHVLALHGIHESAWPTNDALCSILQIINHIQDCADDYRELDRVYLPLDILEQEGGLISDLSRVEATPGLRKALNVMLDRLDKMMKLAVDFPTHVPDTRLKCETSIIIVLAERLIQRLGSRDPLSEHVKLGKPQIFQAVISGLVRAFL